MVVSVVLADSGAGEPVSGAVGEPVRPYSRLSASVVALLLVEAWPNASACVTEDREESVSRSVSLNPPDAADRTELPGRSAALLYQSSRALALPVPVESSGFVWTMEPSSLSILVLASAAGASGEA